MGERLEGQSGELIGAVAEEFAQRLVDPLPVPIQADVGQRATGQLENGAEALFALPQLVLHPLAFGAVQAHADHLHRAPGGILQGGGAGGDPALLAIGVKDAEVELVALALGHALAVDRLQRLHVLGVQVRPEILVAAHRPAIHGLDVGRVGDFVGDQVPFPVDDAGAFLGQLHARFAFHDLGGVLAPYIGHGQVLHLDVLGILQGLVAVAQPDPVDLEEGRQHAQVVVVDLAATGPFVHRGARNAEHRCHGLQRQFLVFEQFFEAEGEAVFCHGKTSP
ncbi:hypothetical protein D3C85_1142440 [compost metagenome]